MSGGQGRVQDGLRRTREVLRQRWQRWHADSQSWIETVDIVDVGVGDRLEETVWAIGRAVTVTGTVTRVTIQNGSVALSVSLDRPVTRLTGTVKEINVERPPGQWVKRLKIRQQQRP